MSKIVSCGKSNKSLMGLIASHIDNYAEDPMDEITTDELYGIVHPPVVEPEQPPEPYTDNIPFIYTFDGNEIVLTKYTGADADITIPATYIVEDVTYNVALGGIVISGTVYSMFSNTPCKKVTISDGVAFYKDQMSFGGSNLEEIHIGHVDTSRATDINYYFFNCQNLRIITGLENIDTSHATTAYGVFANCYSLTSLSGIENWDVSNITNMNQMFVNVAVKTLDLHNWDTSNLVSMRQMFANMHHLISIDISTWPTTKVTNMNKLFYDNTKLSVIDMRSADTSKVTDMDGMFVNLLNISKIYVSATGWKPTTDNLYGNIDGIEDAITPV